MPFIICIVVLLHMGYCLAVVLRMFSLCLLLVLGQCHDEVFAFDTLSVSFVCVRHHLPVSQ